jgi:S1-C subfamily serine protease
VVSEQVGRGRANLPVNVGPGGGDGPVVIDDGIAAFLGGKDPASRQGLRPRDVIVAVDGKPVADLSDLARVLGEKDEGETVEVVVRRRGERVSVRVRLVGAGE